MTNYPRSTMARTALLASGIALVAMLGACGKKEEAPPVSTVVPAPEAPAPVAPPAPMPAPPAAATTVADAEAEMRKSDCFMCHAVDTKVIGPAYSWVAFRYKSDKDAVQKLMASVKNGGAGKWNAYTGGAPMTPHPQLTDDQLKLMVEWVLAQTPVEAPKP